MVSGIKSGAYVLEQKQRNALVLYIKKNVIGDSAVRSLSFDRTIWRLRLREQIVTEQIMT